MREIYLLIALPVRTRPKRAELCEYSRRAGQYWPKENTTSIALAL